MTMKIAYVTTYDAADRNQWSGLGYSIKNSLQQAGASVTPLGPLATNKLLLGRTLSALHSRILGTRYEYQREEHVCRYYAQQVKTHLDAQHFDAVFSPGAIPVSRLSCSQPIVIYADATFRSYAEHYGIWSEYSMATRRAAEATERSAYQRARLTIFASEWAAESARVQYDVPPEKIRIIPFGANLDNCPSPIVVEDAISTRPKDRCKLVSIGVDWTRKGMQKAVELTCALNARGLPTTLSIVGCKPPRGVTLPPFVELVGFLDKKEHDGEKKIVDLLLNSHFHLLFSSAEAFGVVFAEANACGVPNIASDLGGISTAVINGAGGQRFGSHCHVGTIAEYVANLHQSPRYSSVARRARLEYEQRLNWDVTGEALKREIRSIGGLP